MTWPFARQTYVGALLDSEFSSPVSLGFTVSQRSFAERTATWTPHPRDFFTASERTTTKELVEMSTHVACAPCATPGPGWHVPEPEAKGVVNSRHGSHRKG